MEGCLEGLAYKNMSIFYNKKDKNHFGVERQEKRKEEQNQQDKNVNAQKQSANAKSFSAIKRIPVNKNAGNIMRNSSEQKVKSNIKQKDREGKERNDVVYTKNRNQTTPSEYHQVRGQMKPTQPRKAVLHGNIDNVQLNHDNYLQRTQSQNSSSLTVQSNQRQKILINKEKLNNFNKRSVTERPEEQRPPDSRNQFIPEYKGQQNRKYIYKKHMHKKEENSKERLRNKLGFIVDLVKDDEIASVSYYSSTNSAQRETIQQFHREQQQQEQEEPKQPLVKEVKKERAVQKEENLAEAKNYDQPIIIIKAPVKHIKKEKQTQNKKIKEQEQNNSKERQHQFKVKKRETDTIKKVDDYAQKKPEEPFKKVKNVKKLFKEETKPNEKDEFEKIVIHPKRSEQRNIFEIKQHQMSPKDKHPEPQKSQQTFAFKKDLKLNQAKTVKKAPQAIQVKNPVIIPKIKLHQNEYAQQRQRGSDEQLLTLIKENDKIIDKQKKSIDQNEGIDSNMFNYQHSSRRRLKTELDHRCDDFQPLTEEERKFIIILKRREEEMMNRIREELLSNPRANTYQFKDYSSNREQTPSFHQKYQAKPIETNESYNPREMSKMFPTIDSRLKTNQSQYSELSHNPLSLKSFRAIQSIYMKDHSTDQHSLQGHKFQDSLEELKYKRDLQNKQHYQYLNTHLRNDVSERDYRTHQIREKYYRLKNLVQRL